MKLVPHFFHREARELPTPYIRKTTQSKPSTINNVKNGTENLITVITDNHLMADTIAKAICANETHDGYYLGNGYAVTWTNGELIEAAFKVKNSLVLSTSMKSREVYAHNFEFAMRNYDEVVGYKKSAADARHLGTIRSLWEKSHTVINAMLPCKEGELMFLNLYYFLATPVTVKRA